MRVSENWRLKKQRYALEGKVSQDGKVVFPPRDVEPRQVETYDFNKQAETYEWPAEMKVYEKAGR